MIDLIQQKIQELNALCVQHRVDELYLFGSAAKGEFIDSSSDLDFAVRFSDQIDPVDMADLYFGLLEELENLFDRPIDVLSIPAIRNPVIIRELEHSKIKLYAA